MGFFPDFHQIKTFGVAVVLPPPTPVTNSIFTQRQVGC